MKSVLNRIWKSIQRPCFEFAQKSLYLRPELFNGIQIGTIRWKISANDGKRRAGCLCADESSAGKRRIRAGRRSAQRHQHKKALSLIFALQIRESAFVLLTMRLLSQRIRSTPNSEKIIRQPSLFQHYALIGAQRVGGVGVVTQQFLGIGPAYGQGLGNFPLPQVAENQQLRLAVVPAIG